MIKNSWQMQEVWEYFLDDMSFHQEMIPKLKN